VLDYRIRIPPARYSVWLNCAAMLVGATLLKDMDDKMWRFYFMLCLGYWREAVPSYPVFSQVVLANLSMALQRGAMSTSEANSIRDEFQAMRRPYEVADVASSSIMDFEQALSSETGSRIHELAERFEEMTMFDALTTGDY
jgi:hypothetical protein